MQRRELLILRASVATLLLAASLACGGAADNAPAVGSVKVALSRPRVALGSPVEITYTFTLAPTRRRSAAARCSSTSSTPTTR